MKGQIKSKATNTANSKKRTPCKHNKHPANVPNPNPYLFKSNLQINLKQIHNNQHNQNTANPTKSENHQTQRNSKVTTTTNTPQNNIQQTTPNQRSNQYNPKQSQFKSQIKRKLTNPTQRIVSSDNSINNQQNHKESNTNEAQVKNHKNNTNYQHAKHTATQSIEPQTQQSIQENHKSSKTNLVVHNTANLTEITKFNNPNGTITLTNNYQQQQIKVQ